MQERRTYIHCYQRLTRASISVRSVIYPPGFRVDWGGPFDARSSGTALCHTWERWQCVGTCERVSSRKRRTPMAPSITVVGGTSRQRIGVINRRWAQTWCLWGLRSTPTQRTLARSTRILDTLQHLPHLLDLPPEAPLWFEHDWIYMPTSSTPTASHRAFYDTPFACTDQEGVDAVGLNMRSAVLASSVTHATAIDHLDSCEPATVCMRFTLLLTVLPGSRWRTFWFSGWPDWGNRRLIQSSSWPGCPDHPRFRLP